MSEEPKPAAPDAQTLVGQGMAALQQRRWADAEAAFRQALAAEPLEPTALRNLTALLQLKEQPAEAIALADAALARDAANGVALVCKADAVAALGRYDEAVSLYRAALHAGHVNEPAIVNLASALAAAGDPDAAVKALDDLLALAPDAAWPKLQRGQLKLKLRDFETGWTDYETRWRADRFLAESRGLVPPGMIKTLAVEPRPEDLAGQRILLIGEQGIGDQVMFASMIPDLARTASKVTCICDPRLVRLFSNSFDNVTVSAPAEAQVDVRTIDREVAFGSLGSAFRRSEAAFPSAPYLKPRAEVRDRWAARIGPKRTALRIGLSWRGGAPTTRRMARSLRLEQLAPLLDLKDVELFSLQYGDPRDELDFFNGGRDNPIRSFAPVEIEDFEELAGLVANLDAVVSVQTSLVHLCGAIGARCLTLVPRNPEWRYMAEGSSMPWYGSVQLFRQDEAGDWGPVVQAVAEALVPRA